MSGFSKYMVTTILNSTLRGVDFPKPTKVYAGLCIADPNVEVEGESSEITTDMSSSYKRIDVTEEGDLLTAWTEPSEGSVSNTKLIRFDPITGVNPITVTHIGIYDAPVGGNLLYYSAIQGSKLLDVGDVIGFQSGSLRVTVD